MFYSLDWQLSRLTPTDKMKRDRAFPAHSYPCVGSFQFLYPVLSTLPWYAEALNELKQKHSGDDSSSKSTNSHTLSVLDVGCGLGQELRFLTLNGVSAAGLCGLDTSSDLWNSGAELFKDEGRFKFLKCDLFDPELPSKIATMAVASKGLEDEPAIGKVSTVNIIIATHFFHLFNLETQILAAINLIRLSKPGTQMIGYQIGRTGGMTHRNVVKEMEGRREGECPRGKSNGILPRSG